MARRHMVSLMGRIASPAEPFSAPAATSGPNNAFKIIQSGTNANNNFYITGGAGIDDPAVLYLDGFYLFYKGGFEYTSQNDSLGGGTLQDALQRDSYTKTVLPALTTPGALDRVDVVYVDFSLAEVTPDIVGSEYTDPSLKDPVLGVNSANRLRAVIDVRVKEGWTGQVNDNIYDDPFFDAYIDNQIQHYRCPIAVLHRTAGNPLITDDMIVDLLKRDDLRVYTPKEITHRLRHGGYTMDDVVAGRAPVSAVDETWGSTGKNEGIGTEAFNSDSVTPRVLDDDAKFRMGALSVGYSGTSSPDAEQLLQSEISGGQAYLNGVSVGFQASGITGQRGDTGAVVHVDSRSTGMAAVATRTLAQNAAIAVRTGSDGLPSLEVKGSGALGIHTGLTGPQRELDIVGDARISSDVEIGQDLVVEDTAIVGVGLMVGASGISSVGDVLVRGGQTRPSGVKLGTTGAGAAYWAELNADHSTHTMESYNVSGQTGANFTWYTQISSAKTRIAELSQTGDLSIANSLRVGDSLSVAVNAGVVGTLGVSGLSTLSGGLDANSKLVAYAGTSPSNWFEVAKVRLTAAGTSPFAILRLGLSSFGTSTGNFWDADVTVAAKVQTGVPIGHHVSGVMRSSLGVLNIRDVVEVVRSAAAVGGYYEYSLFVKPEYAYSFVMAVVLGGNATQDTTWNYVLPASSVVSLPGGVLSAGSDVVSVETNMYVPGNLGVSGAATVTDSLSVGTTLSVNGEASIGGTVTAQSGIQGPGFDIPGSPNTSTPAFFGTTGQISGYTGGADHTVEIGTGALTVGNKLSWGTFVGTDDNGIVGYKMGMGNTQPGRARTRGWLPSDLRVIAEKASMLRGIAGIAFDSYGNCIAAIKDYAQEGAVSIVYVDTNARTTKVIATGFRAISDIKASPDGFMYVSSELGIPSQDFKLARVTLHYNAANVPVSASVQPIALDVSVYGIAGLAIAKADMSFDEGTFSVGTIFIIENRSSAAKLLAVDPDSGITSTLYSSYSKVAAMECGALYGADHALYVVQKTTGAVLSKVLVDGSPAAFGTPSSSLAFRQARKLHLGVDGYMYAVDGVVSNDSGRVIRYDQDGLADLVVAGLASPMAFAVDAHRVMHIGDNASGTLYSRAVPGALVVHMDSSTAADNYDFPGNVALDTEVKEVEIDIGEAGLLSIYGADLRVDKKLVVENDAFFGSDVYVDGNLHMDSMEAGDFRATVMVVGKNTPAGSYWSDGTGASGTSGLSGASGSVGSAADLDLWGDAILQKMLLVGIDPSSSYATSLISMGVEGTGGVAAYVFGELQAFDYRAVGKDNSIGIYSIETQSGIIAALIGGDPATPFDEAASIDGTSGSSGSSGSSGLSGINRKVGIHLVDADTLVVDKDAGDQAAFMSVRGDMEVARGLSTRNIINNALTPDGVMLISNKVKSYDTTRVIRKEFATSMPMRLRASRNYTGVISTFPGIDAWRYSSATGFGESQTGHTTGIPGSYGSIELGDGIRYEGEGVSGMYRSMDAIVLASLGTITMRYAACRDTALFNASDVYWCHAANVVSSYTFSSPFFGTQNWLSAAGSEYRNVVNTRLDITEGPGTRGYANASHISKSLQVFISMDSWFVDGSVSAPNLQAPFYYGVYNSFTGLSGSQMGAKNLVNYALLRKDCIIRPDGYPVNSDVNNVITVQPNEITRGYEYEVTRYPVKIDTDFGSPSSDYILALYPRMTSLERVDLGTSGNFDRVGKWDLQLCLVPLIDVTVARLTGSVILSDSGNTNTWSSANMPWTFADVAPWASPEALQASINSDKFVFEQLGASTSWYIVHDLGGHPAVEVVDLNGNVVLADIQYNTPNALTITFNTAVAGRAYLN
jgi:hypothetical protein